MNKNLLSIAILILAAAIVVVNVWKPSFTEGETEKPTETVNSASQEDIPGAKLSELEEGSEAPDFELTTLAGEKAKLSDYRGQKVILNFWATWCPPCKAEMPHMQSFYEKNKDKGITILAVNLTNVDKGMDAINAFVKEYGLTFPILLDEDGTVGMTYQAFSIPTSYIIDKNGKIAKKIVGPMDEEKMKQLTANLK
ncbi:peroxiredoxin family protein [Bacillus sp. V33-4]|uniref:peroxiredoxin family protein n=1 Tax=Bacillus sp. V33-4 TaxID=2054169 RepID=UPI000C784FCB|nr:redoxin domain-containing protein [Bacillus sp. V33-4]PLR83666.1 cytochrome C biogenesis protein [Bacillus sp. V33-4]